MAKKSAVPEVRFKGFEGEWEERKLVDDLVSIQTGTNLLGTPSNTGTPLLKMGNIQRGYFSLEKIEFLSATQTVEPENIAYYGDFFFNTRNTLDLVGKGATWAGSDGKYAFNNNIARFVFNGLDTFFFNYLYNTQTMIKQVRSRAMGTTSVAAIYPQSLNSLEYKLPDNKEQTRIGALFRNLDARITLEQRKHEKLQNIKKAMLEKMFPKPGATEPEVRFKGFGGEWEERRVSSLSELTFGGGTPSTSNKEFWNGEIPWIQSSDLIEDDVLHVNPCKFITTKGLQKSATKVVPKDSIAIVTRVGVGKLALVPFRYTTSQDFFSLASLNIEKIFCTYLLYILMQKEQYSVQGTSIKGITKEDLLNKKSFVSPNKTEQTRIGDFFRNLDRLLSLQQRKCGKLQNIKKAMLGKMFV